MIYLLNDNAGQEKLILKGETYKYLVKVLHHCLGDELQLRNKENIEELYLYKIIAIDGRKLELALLSKQEYEVKPSKNLHIAWCIIDPKSIEKVLPSLNEIGVEKITFIYCKRSQKSFKLDFKRLEKILLNSSQQSGRSKMMKLEMSEDLQTFIAQNPQSKMLNFSKNNFIQSATFDTIVVGCEGGLHEDEIALFKAEDIIGFNTPLVLKSESATCAVASKILL